MSRSRSIRALNVQTNAGSRSSSVGPPSPTFSDATNASQVNLGLDGPAKIITRANLKSSVQGYEDLVNTCANYRAALMDMSKATASFADAMQTCSGLKGATYESGTRLQAASGLHHLMGNHWHVLSVSLEQNFERPLRQHLENYRQVVAERSVNYEKALREKSAIIRRTEAENMNIGRKKQRNLQTFREALAVLQRQVDELDALKVQHYQEILEHEEEVWDFVQGKVSLVVRSTLDVFDRFAAKASDPVLEPMLQSVPDPFDSYGPPKPEDQIFSILPPLDILNNVPSPSPSSQMSSLESEPAPLASKTEPAPAWVSHSLGYASSEWADATSPPRSPSPQSSSSPITRSPSPPSTLSSRRHSYPVSSGKALHHAPRKSETKLRNVLSVIDESHSSAPSVAREASEDTVRLSSADAGIRTQMPDFAWVQRNSNSMLADDGKEFIPTIAPGLPIPDPPHDTPGSVESVTTDDREGDAKGLNPSNNRTFK
ncbi:hypothetical protein BD410DRAFT_779692 [Rickenella mellea]|uniref:IMD domain-containing protein n=1 Tax=Rickenella mellea TaxID=50990 RepID=A0A4R5XE01_9AGAM|nr:hypothetical protein BD410DRAFT_779692 [Rickenella mellea]